MDSPLFKEMIQHTAQIATQTALQQARETQQNTSPLFTDIADSWFAFMRHEWSVSTYQKNLCLYESNVLSLFKDMTLEQLSIKVIQKHLDMVGQAHKYSTMKVIKSIIKRILDYAEAQDLIHKNPMQFVNITKGEQNHKRSLSPAEIKALLKASHTHWLWIAPIILLCTGMRRSELLGLDWADVDLINGEIHITKGYVKLPKSSNNIVNPPKTQGSKRTIPIDKTLVSLLKDYKEIHGKGRTYVISQQRQNKRVNPRDFDTILKRWCRQAGIENITSHYFRHTFATMAYEEQQQTLTIAKQLGHVNTRMVEEIYIHPTTTTAQRTCVNEIAQKIFGDSYIQ